MTDQNQSLKTKLSALKEAFQQRWAAFSEKSPRWAQVVKYTGFAGLGGLFSLFLFVQLVRFGAFGSLPSVEDLKDIKNYTASEVYSEDGQLLGKYFVENRKNVGVDEVSKDLTLALIATEDARFFDHRGIDMRAWLRVFFRTVLLRDQSSGGGSTLSQQLAKNLYSRKNYRFLSIAINKTREMYIAKRLERVYSKEELLNLYLNTVPFGVNIYGVEVAAKQFFGSTAKDIKTENAAVLIGMLKANTYYNPVRNPDHAIERRNTVLSQMTKYNYLSKAVSDSLQQLPLKVNYTRESNNEGLATYFREQIRKELTEEIKNYTKPDGKPYNLYTDGLRIYTTIDSRMQAYAEESVNEHLSRLQKDFDKHWKGRKPWGSDKVLNAEIQKSGRYKNLKAKGLSAEEIDEQMKKPVNMTIFTYKGDEQKMMSPLDSIKYYYALLNAGFLVMDPHTGALKAWVGGIDHQYFKYDHIRSRRQVGSTFKPVVYASAIKNGFRPCDFYYNRLVTYTEYDNWKPENSDGHYGGVYSMQGALTKSVNSVAVDLIIRNGVDSVRHLAQQMGVTNEVPKAPAIALGAVEVSLYDMLTVYGTLANRGKKPEAHYITRIETSKGEVIANFEYNPANFKMVLSRDESDLITEMMQSVVDSGTARRLRYQYHLQNDIAGKTGTTQSHADGWFIGYTPHLVAGAWVGGESPRVRFRSIGLGQGANTALPIWGRFMNKVYKDKAFRKWKNDKFPEPSFEVQEALDCPPYLDDIPILVSAEQDSTDSFDKKLDGLFDVFRKNKRGKDGRPINTNPRDIVIKKKQERSDEIRKKNEKTKKKRERKKKRKEFWGKIFKKD